MYVFFSVGNIQVSTISRALVLSIRISPCKFPCYGRISDAHEHTIEAMPILERAQQHGETPVDHEVDHEQCEVDLDRCCHEPRTDLLSDLGKVGKADEECQRRVLYRHHVAAGDCWQHVEERLRQHDPQPYFEWAQAQRARRLNVATPNRADAATDDLSDVGGGEQGEREEDTRELGEL